ncbi:MAG: BON domain-containing protein, partial [Polyangiaceae bacterium]
MKFSRSWRTSVLVFAVVGAAACIPQPKEKYAFTGVDSPDPIVNDIQINRAINERIAADPSLSSQGIVAVTSSGIVTLNGSADNLPSKDKARRIAGAIRGVRAVVDDVTVKPASRPDEKIVGDVKSALVSDPATKNAAVEVASARGLVTLTGTVGSWQEKQLLTGVAMMVPGVKQVDNAVVVARDLNAKKTDAEIASAVKQRLGFDMWLDGSLVDVNVKNGVVTLSGVVATPELRNRAIADSWVTGVSAVTEDGLVINWWAQTRNRRANELQERTDPEIAQAVRDSFLYDARLKVHAPDVAVRDGQVMLEGQLDNMPARLAAAEDAGNTVGVRDVVDQVVVVPGVDVSDADVVRSARAAVDRERPGMPNEVSFSSDGG